MKFRAACLGLVLVAATAWADARVEAKKRFKQGMAMIADGRFEEGIDALLEAYSIKPHPNVLYNVARAYESANKYQEALAYYRRYLDTGPADAATVRSTIVRLESKLPPPEPKKPDPVVEAPRPSPNAPAVDPATVQRLELLAQRLEAALERAETSQAVRVVPRAAEPLGPDGLPPPGPEVPVEETTEIPYEETVVTASKRAQSTLEAPNATTVITAEEIRLSGALNLQELLRRVPGAEVMMLGVGSANVSMRGFNQRIANKVLVLVDGRPEYQDFIGLTLWSNIPVGLDEIDRIEVIRGPGSALYGANAMLGVINIITRAPGTGRKTEFSGWAGNGNYAGGSFVASGGDKVKFRASAGYTQSNKFSRDYAQDRPDIESAVADPNLGLRSVRGNLTAYYAFNRDFSVAASAGINRQFTEIYPLGLLRNFYLDGLGGYAKADATLGPVKVRFFWNHLSAEAGPQYQPVGQRSLDTRLESNVFDVEALYQLEFELLGTHRLGVGASGRLKRVAWTYLGSLKQEFHAAAFIQEEWRPFRIFSLVASYRIDRHPLLDKGQPGYAQSPRVSVLLLPVEGQAIRASFATAFRTPTFLESYTDIRIPVPGVNGASVLTNGDRTLRPERLISFELGWRGELAKYGFEYDLALYWNVVSDLISLTAVQPVSPGQAFDPQTQSFLLGRSVFFNDPTAYTARGGEAGLKWSALQGLDLRTSLAVQTVTRERDDGTPCGPCSQAPVFKLFFGGTFRTRVGLELGADIAYQTGTVWVEREPSAQDPTQIANVSNPLSGYSVINARLGYRLLEDRITVAIVGTQLGPQQAQHPFGNLSERRVFATVTVTP